MSIFTGSNSERQSVGLPGHCDDCAEQGHVAAHPDLGCGDVGCTSAHDEPSPLDAERPTLAESLRRTRWDGYDIGAVVAGDTIGPLAERITTMLSHDRRLVKIHRYATHHDLTVDPGLRPDPDREDAVSLKAMRYPEGGRQFWVDLSPGIRGFGFSAVDSMLERHLRGTYERHHKRMIEGFKADHIYNQPVTYVHVTGRGTEPGRHDRIDIEDWNEHGVGQLTSIVFQCDWDY